MEEHKLESYKKAGMIAQELKKYARNIITPGRKLYDIAVDIDNKIAELGAETAFPVNLSVNDIAAHYTPEEESEDKAEGLLKVDIGICINGYIADTAFSIDLTEEQKHKEQIKANKKVLEAIEQMMNPETVLGDVGTTAETTLEEYNKEHNTNFSIVRGLCGHSLGKDTIHSGITIPNYKNNNNTPLQGKAIAIEPFITTGNGDIYEGKGGGIYALKKELNNIRDPEIKKIYNYIKETYKTRPFCKRWLTKKEFKRINYSLNILTQQGIITHYGLLIEKDKKPVSQQENTFIIKEKEVIITTKEE